MPKVTPLICRMGVVSRTGSQLTFCRKGMRKTGCGNWASTLPSGSRPGSAEGMTFSTARLSDEMKAIKKRPAADLFRFVLRDNFEDCDITESNTKHSNLKIWEHADPAGIYVLGADPAFGENENNDRSSIQVLRCYADGVDQVAEYASAMTNTRQFAWVIASLLGWYGGGNAEVRYALELNGPGGAVFGALKQLKYQLENGHQPKDVKEKGLTDVFRNVKTYIWNRVDSMGAGYSRP